MNSGLKCPNCGASRNKSLKKCECGYSFEKKVHGYLLPDEHIARLLPLATPFERLGGQIVDGIVQLLIYLSGYALSNVTNNSTYAITGLFVAFGYRLFSDGLPNGQSLGKIFMNTMAVSVSEDKPCDYLLSLVRNLFLQILGPIDWILIFFPGNQRLGDKAAGTIVLKQKT